MPHGSDMAVHPTEASIRVVDDPFDRGSEDAQALDLGVGVIDTQIQVHRRFPSVDDRDVLHHQLGLPITFG